METLWIECEDGVERPFHAKHTDVWYDLSDEDQRYEDREDYLVPILYEDGEPIPKKICLCAAHSEDECCCGAWYGDYDNYFKDATHEAWVTASKEGRYTAGKSANSPLYNALKKLGFSNNTAGKITKRITKFVIGVD